MMGLVCGGNVHSGYLAKAMGGEIREGRWKESLSRRMSKGVFIALLYLQTVEYILM